jgi:tetratricopeptide (TPR) repeat protein
MLTTEKWGEAARALARAAPVAPKGGHQTAPARRNQAVWREAVAALLLALLLGGCSPPGARALKTGEQLLREGRPAEAVGPLTNAIILLATNAPACAQAWNHLGLAYHYSGRPLQADQAYQRALAKDFNLFAARFNRGCLLLEQNSLPGAISELTSFTAHCPEKAEGWIKLGTAQLRARQYEAAERSFQQVVKLNPRPAMLAEAWNGLGLSQAWQRRPREALQSLDAALRQQTNYTPALLNQAIIAQQSLNDRPLALRKYRTYLSSAAPGPNHSAVAAIVKQLELSLRPVSPPAAGAATQAPPHLLAATQQVRPPALAATQQVRPPALAATVPGPTPALPAPPAPVQTSAPPKAEPPPALGGTSPPPRQVAQAPARPEPSQAQVGTQQPAVKSQPEPPLEVVKLATEPEIKPAQEVSLPAPQLSAPAPAAPPPMVAPPPAQPAPSPAAKAPPAQPLARAPAKPKPAKKSLLQTINPANWVGSINPLKLFGGKKQPAAQAEAPPAPLTPAPVKTPAVSPPLTLATSVGPAPAPRPKLPVFARYQYHPVVKPAAGNRAEAARFFAEGVEAHKRNRAGEALAAYQKAVAADPSFFDAQYNLGAVAYQIADWPGALSAYEQALIIAPADVNARYNFALTLQKANYPLDAANELDAILAAQPDDHSAHLALANLQAYSLAQPAKAREHYLKVLQLQPTHPQANLIRAWLLANP